MLLRIDNIKRAFANYYSYAIVRNLFKDNDLNDKELDIKADYYKILNVILESHSHAFIYRSYTYIELFNVFDSSKDKGTMTLNQIYIDFAKQNKDYAKSKEDMAQFWALKKKFNRIENDNVNKCVAKFRNKVFAHIEKTEKLDDIPFKDLFKFIKEIDDNFNELLSYFKITCFPLFVENYKEIPVGSPKLDSLVFSYTYQWLKHTFFYVYEGESHQKIIESVEKNWSIVENKTIEYLEI